MSESAAMARAIQTIDSARRVGWAKYFEAVEDRQEALQTAGTYMEYAVYFALRVVHHNRLAFDDELVEIAQSFLDEVGSGPVGHRLIEGLRATL